MTDNIHSQMGFDWPQHPRPKKINPVPLNHLADAIATGDNMEALRILHELASFDAPSPQHVINRCKFRG